MVLTQPSFGKIHKVEYNPLPAPHAQHEIFCESQNDLYVYALQFKLPQEPNTKIDIKLKIDKTNYDNGYQRSPDKSFIHNEFTGEDILGEFEPGRFCFRYEDKTTRNKYPIFILVMTKAPVEDGQEDESLCQVQKIITSNFLRSVGCHDKSVDLWEIVTFSGGKGDLTEFKSIEVDEQYLSEYYKRGAYRVIGSSLSDIDEDMIKVFFYQASWTVSMVYPAPLFNMKAYKKINSEYSINSGLTKITPSVFIKRLMVFGYPGFLLGDKNRPDLQNFIFQSMIGAPSDHGEYVSLNFMFYVTRPERIEGQEEHHIEIEVKPFKYTKGRTEGNLLEVFRSIQLMRNQKDKKKLFIAMYDKGQKLGHTQGFEDSQDFGYLYLSLTVGIGIMRNQGVGEKVMVKFFDTLTIYQVGAHQPKVLFKIRHKQLDFREVFSVKHFEANERSVKISQTSYPNNANRLHIRVLEATRGSGAYPSHLGTSIETLKQFDRCFVRGYREDHCMALALYDNGPLKNVDEAHRESHTVQQPQTLANGRTLRMIQSDPALKDGCLVGYFSKGCFVSRKGYVLNMVHGLRTPKESNVMSNKEFDEMDQKYKHFYVQLFTGEDRRVVAACPYECKVR